MRSSYGEEAAFSARGVNYIRLDVRWRCLNGMKRGGARRQNGFLSVLSPTELRFSVQPRHEVRC